MLSSNSQLARICLPSRNKKDGKLTALPSGQRFKWLSGPNTIAIFNAPTTLQKATVEKAQTESKPVDRNACSHAAIKMIARFCARLGRW
jgi:hypothetical protein